ncbi:FAR1 DNA binding domain [Macleaya cordata]|uniref:FAR1 DNA binding domain n=1 Tax=Macleaya cordata TaxID=56857 RepID=A0A200R846_MACCD|nr:FAR1 DNA binding domain [Macleaya cordata]
MDVEVINVEEENRAAANAPNAEACEGGDERTTENSLEKDLPSQDDDEIGEPHVGMEFESEDAAKMFYDAYARQVGFSTRIGQCIRSEPDGTVTDREFACSKESLKRKNADSCCSAMLKIERKDPNKWVATKFVKEHNHSTMTPSKVHQLRSRRHFAGAAKNISETYQVGLDPGGAMYVPTDGNHAFVGANHSVRNVPPVEQNRAVRNSGPILIRFAPRRTYRVAKFEDDHKSYTVTLNVPEMRACCSCQMFEFSGILCRHVLTVFTVTNVLTLPSHYILKRWTRNAKSWVGSDEHGGEVQGEESLTIRYNSLCQEAIKYAEEGAIATETYNVAMGALREGGKKVSVVKKDIARVPRPSSQISGSNQEDNNRKMPSDMSPSLWPRQEEENRRFNLNDARAPTSSVTDLNLPHMAPVSLHRDDGLPDPDNMVVLPCLKSMTWVMENKTSAPANRVAVINLKLQDYSKAPSGESEVKFQLSSVTLEPMLRSMAYISEQLSTPANRVAVINLKLQDSETTSGESEVKFQVSRDTLGAMLRSMAYIREQLANVAEPQSEPSKKQRNVLLTWNWNPLINLSSLVESRCSNFPSNKQTATRPCSRAEMVKVLFSSLDISCQKILLLDYLLSDGCIMFHWMMKELVSVSSLVVEFTKEAKEIPS